jgi:hypothetical protein
MRRRQRPTPGAARAFALSGALLASAALAQQPAPRPTSPAKQPAQPTPTPTPAPAPAPARLPVAFPHPLIVEVLYAVPTGEAGDANRDGFRQVSGDEFVALVNPHTAPINLRGYSLSDRPPSATAAPKVRFTFPDAQLAPGQIAVVFNGHESTIPGPVGDSARAPTGPNPSFHNALTFTMRVASSRTSFGNAEDLVALSAPGSSPGTSALQIVRWGRADTPSDRPAAPIPGATPTTLIEDAPATAKGSVVRRSLAGEWTTREAFDAKPFDPGAWTDHGSPAKPTAPAPNTPSAPTKPTPTKPAPSTPAPAPVAPAPSTPAPSTSAPLPTQAVVVNRTGRELVVDLGTIYTLGAGSPDATLPPGAVAEGSSVPLRVAIDATITHTFADDGPSPRHYVRVALAELPPPGQTPGQPAGQPSPQRAIVRLLPDGRLTRLSVEIRDGSLVVEAQP